ncbi:nitrous oxide reductase accessory protein NosL [Accumulibacter sp.]|uniref:nitrous oxide reductase accessory protein NosL n=1 Tax=Accumulibacter sp. TaxID=2053492 RepID=UPI0025D29338|nr:nitrous oxide reductase accessory protein NosL [Accumulibacter sp.]MCM8611799.1 nitrous oxide reductase accessory protein NosL [Accumulibacter sp.]MCM8635663.1 nitrous oxide reductase accessory protein NosL [Accumulibacter sp.]MCM8639342.1 nitrous oxide reductase accessory protein NosL [Accumulibacter sp.]
MSSRLARWLVAGALWLAAGLALASALPPKPGERDLCPVCGMLVSRYPHWIAVVAYRDGQAHFFDGAKDLFKYLGNLARHAPGRSTGDIASIWVTEYYGLTRIDARRAFYVIGSDVPGPMGHEFVPFATRADAEEFLKEHRGHRIVSFGEATAELAARLDKGLFD